MAPKRKPAVAAERDLDGIFRGVSAFIVPHGVQARRLEVWKQRLVQMGGRVVEKPTKGELAGVNHVLAMDAKALLRELDAAWLHRFRGEASSGGPSIYAPADLNRNITKIFGRLIDIYRALGDDRRSFSYYKAIPVIEKLPFKIESADQVKGLPTIGKSLKDHINEIVTTGKLSKLEHFENDEKFIW